MGKLYKAHIDEVTGRVQTVKEHSENTALFCEDFAVPELKEIMYVMGLLHDIGKYQVSFQERINGKNISIEHSICGAIEAQDKYKNAVGLLMAYCIAGHHSGLPDGGSMGDTPDLSTLQGRLKRTTEDYSVYKHELQIPQIAEQDFLQFMLSNCGNDIGRIVDEFAFLTRYCFSCLTDADSLDTAYFCEKKQEHSLRADFAVALQRIEDKLSGFICKTDLQKSRAYIQGQAFEKVNQTADIFLMNMPTGSGKTLCSAKFALERAIKAGKKRVIYIIPYNSIIEQTAEVFENLFGKDVEILRHQSTFSYEEAENVSEDYREAAKSAVENWSAPFIITTAVQFFESIHANKRGKLRKLHNMADSILVFDEAHLMPQKYLQPCLQAIAFITRYLRSEALFLTATMPNFEKLMKQYALPDSKISSLITDTTLFSVFQKCRYVYVGKMGKEALLDKARRNGSNLIVVNTKKTAQQLYQACRGKKYHLSTYMTGYDRKRVLDEIKEELSGLDRDFSDLSQVPDERRITVISTSLIEAGIDLDFYAVFRELSGLDSILQAGGRCNREGKRKRAEVTIFEYEYDMPKVSADERGNIVKGLLEKYEDVSCADSVKEYYDRLFFIKEKEIQQYAMHQRCMDIRSIPFREYAEQFEIIDSRTVSIVVERDEESRKLIEGLKTVGAGNSRKLQKYACSVMLREFDDLLKQHVLEDYGTGIWCLTNPDYYDVEMGILFEAKDYFL